MTKLTPPGAYMTKSTPGYFKASGGRLSKLSSVANTDFGRMKGRNRRIVLIKKTLVCVVGVLKCNYDIVHCLKMH